MCSELEILASEWRSVTVVSLNAGGGARLIKPANMYMCMQTHYKHDEDGRTAPGVGGHGSVPLSHSGNVVTWIGLHTQSTSEQYLKYFFFQHMTLRSSCPTRLTHTLSTSLSRLLRIYYQWPLMLNRITGHFFRNHVMSEILIKTNVWIKHLVFLSKVQRFI